jgi:hypothetical protein
MTAKDKIPLAHGPTRRAPLSIRFITCPFGVRCSENNNNLFILLFSFQLSFFLCTSLGLFLLFLSAFIFTCHIVIIRFSAFENERSARFRRRRLVERPFYPIWNICFASKADIYQLERVIPCPQGTLGGGFWRLRTSAPT